MKGDPKILEKNGLAGKKIGKEVGRGKKIKNFGLQMKLQKIITSFYQIIRKKILWSKKINYLKNNIIKSLDKPKFNEIKYKSSLKILHTKQSQIKNLKSLKFTHCCSLSLTLALCLSLSQLYFSFDLIKDLT